MKKLRCITIDDEPLALDLIAGYIEKTPFLELSGKFENPLEALEFLNNNSIDLIFLDIQMPDIKGTELAHSLEKDIKIIFTTAYKDYAFEGFELDAMDYLQKPISYVRFLKSSQKALNRINSENRSNENHENQNSDDYFFIKADYQVRKILFAEILYFEALKDYVKIYIKGENSPIVFHSTLKSLLTKIPAKLFMRVHRSYIINLNNVETIERNHVIFGKNRIPISEQYRESFGEFLKKGFL